MTAPLTLKGTVATFVSAQLHSCVSIAINNNNFVTFIFKSLRQTGIDMFVILIGEYKLRYSPTGNYTYTLFFYPARSG